MRKSRNQLKKRADHVLNEVKSRPISTTRAVSQLSEELFLSEKTIWNDLQRATGGSSPSSKY